MPKRRRQKNVLINANITLSIVSNVSQHRSEAGQRSQSITNESKRNTIVDTTYETGKDAKNTIRTLLKGILIIKRSTTTATNRNGINTDKGSNGKGNI